MWCSTDRCRFRMVEDHIADLHVLIDAQTLRNAALNPQKIHTFFVLSSCFPIKNMSFKPSIPSPVEAVAQDHNYATERLSLALAEAEELDDFLRQMKGSELLVLTMGQVNLEYFSRGESLGSGLQLCFQMNNCSVWEGTIWLMQNVIGDGLMGGK